MGIRHLPPCWFAVGESWQCNLIIVNYNPHGTICPICRQYIGRIYTNHSGAVSPPTLPFHEHCYCWYERTQEGIAPPPEPPLPPPPPDDPPESGRVTDPVPEVFPPPGEPEEPGYPPPEAGMGP